MLAMKHAFYFFVKSATGVIMTLPFFHGAATTTPIIATNTITSAPAAMTASVSTATSGRTTTQKVTTLASTKKKRVTPAPTPTPVPTPPPTPVVTPTPTPTPTPTNPPVVVVPPASTPTTTPAVSPITNRKNWGAYVGWQDTALTNFESTVGTQVQYQATFVHWGNENQFPTSLAAQLKASGKTLILYWEAMDYNLDPVNQPQFNYDKILAGNYDSYINSFAASVKAYGGPVILILFEEMNGNWYPWSVTQNGNSATKAIAAYRYVHDKFAGVTNVKFGWDLNDDSVPDIAGNQAADVYPGDSYVDYVGVNGFNFGSPWESFDQIFSAPLTKLASYKKPIFIFSMATAEGSNKAAWITDAITVQIPKHPEIVGWIWFNENKEKNWLVNSSSASLSAFTQAIK